MDPVHIAKLCDEFELGNPITWEENHEGVLNRNYELKTSIGRYFVKSVRAKRKASLECISAAETFMHEGGIPAVCMLQSKGRNTFIQCDSDVYCVYPYIEHTRELRAPLEALGDMLARIHLRGAETVPTILEETRLTEKNSVIVLEKLTKYRKMAEQADDTNKNLFLTYIDRKLELLASLPEADTSSSTLVHGDYHLRNILFSESAEIVGICDWEKSELCPRAYEVARSIQYICFEGREAPYVYEQGKALADGRAFLQGYYARYPITPDELLNGFTLRLRKLVMSFWIEELFFDFNDDRSNKFVENETRLLHEFTKPELIQSLIV